MTRKQRLKRRLKSGFTTGTAAAAAAKGALTLILDGRPPESVEVTLLTGDVLTIPILGGERIDAERARCAVIKDAGDDPDVTHRAEIGATVRFVEDPRDGGVVITGGEGVGRVTKPGLETPPGEPAITGGPRRMIRQAVDEVLTAHRRRGRVTARIDVPAGRELARNTLNGRLGIVGGISILGTTGIVRPLSHDAYIATIDAALSVAAAAGVETVVLTTGRRSERFSQERWPRLPEEAFVQIGDFFKTALEKTAARGLRQATLTVFFGKAVKMAQRIPHTHAAKSRLALETLARWALEVTGESTLAGSVASANTARHALSFLWPRRPQVVACVGDRMVAAAEAFAGPAVRMRGVIYDFDGRVIYDSAEAGASVPPTGKPGSLP